MERKADVLPPVTLKQNLKTILSGTTYKSIFRKVKITVDNDANAQAYAEYKYGAGKNHDDMVFITVSTGNRSWNNYWRKTHKRYVRNSW